MARVGVVEPVVVVRDVVGAALALHAEHVGLAGVPEAVVADGDKFRVALDIARAVALGMVAAAVGSVEEVVMVNPDVAVVGVKRQSVVHAAHDADVAELHALGVAHQEPEALDGSVLSDALEGHVQLRVGVAPLHLDALLLAADGIEVVLGDESDEAEGDGGGVIALLVCGNDGLQAGTLRGAALAGGDHGGLDGLRRILGHIEHLGAALQRAVAVVGSRRVAAHEGKALAGVAAYRHVGGLAGSASHLLAVVVDGHHPDAVGAGLQAHHVGAAVAAVVAHQLSVYLGVVAVLAALDIDMIRRSTLQEVECDVCRLLPASGLGDLYGTLGVDDVALAAGVSSPDERDVADVAVVGVAAAGQVDGHAVAVEADVGQGCRVVVPDAVVIQRQHSLVFGVILIDGVILDL